MPHPAKGPRLYLRKRQGRKPVWVIRDSDGSEIGTGCGIANRERAEKGLEAYLGKKHKPNFESRDPGAVLIADVLGLYAQGRLPMIAHPEIALYQLPRLVEFFGAMRVADITPGTCHRYVDMRLAQPRRQYSDADSAPRVAETTIRRELVTLQAAIRYAWKEGKLSHPVYVTKPDESSGRDRWLTRDEAARLLRAAWRTNKHVARFILLALYTGSRHEAVLSLRWGVNSEGGWVDLDHRVIYRRGAGERETAKRQTPVPISDRLAGHLRRWRAASLTHVVEWEGQPVKKLRRAWKRAQRMAGLCPDVTPHVLRHTFATWAVQGGLPLAKIAGALGTTEAMVQRRYGHHAPEHLRDVVEVVAGAKLGRRKS
jgi:integrase